LGVHIGLADQSLYKAHNQTRSTHLLDVVITRENKCVISEGNGAIAYKIAFHSKENKSPNREVSSEDNVIWTDEILPPEVDSLENQP
jgi:hypothetical protein